MLFTIAASPLLYSSGVSFQTISLGFGLLYSILALAEIPTGISADIFGAKKASILGGILQTSALVLFGFGDNSKIQILSAFAMYGLGSSFVSGALSSLMFGNVKNSEGVDFNSSHYFSSLEKVAVASYILASISIGILSEFLGRASFLFGAIFFAAAATVLAIGFKNDGADRKHRSLVDEYSQKLSKGMSAIKSSLQLKILLPIRILHQIETILGVLWLPWIVQLGGGNKIWISILSTGAYLLRYLVNHFVAKKSEPRSFMPRIAFSLSVMALGAFICTITHNVWFALLGVWAMAGARGAFLPSVQAILHAEFNEEVRSTGLSVVNFSTEVMIALSYFVSSIIIDHISVPIAWGISSVSFLAACAIAILFNRESKYEQKTANY